MAFSAVAFHGLPEAEWIADFHGFPESMKKVTCFDFNNAGMLKKERKKENMESVIISLSRSILECPGLFLGKVSWERLKAFIDGYALCLRDIYGDPEVVSGNFHEFVQEKYHSDESWWIIIRNQVPSDAEAFALYGKLLDEYEDLKKIHRNAE